MNVSQRMLLIFYQLGYCVLVFSLEFHHIFLIFQQEFIKRDLIIKISIRSKTRIKHCQILEMPQKSTYLVL